MSAFLHGIIIAFGLIIPLGAQNIFIFNQGASQPRLRSALPSILTAFTCDSLLIIGAVLGVSLIVLQFVWLKLILFIIGFFFLIYMGYLTWKSEPAEFQQERNVLSVRQQIYFAASVSILNPHAILDTVGVLGTSSLNYEGSQKLYFCAACILVSLIWFFGIAALGNFVKKKDKSGAWLKRVNKASALIIWGVSLYILRQIILMSGIFT